MLHIKNKSANLFTGLLVSGFLTLLAMMILVEIGAIRAVDSMANLTKNLHQHPFAVSNAVLLTDIEIIAMHRYMKDVALAQNPEELELAISLVDMHEANVYKHLDFILMRFLGDKTRIEKVRVLFSDWRPIRSEVIDHMLGTPDVPGPVYLYKPEAFYLFEDPELEAMTAGQKVLVRMGSANAATVKETLTKVRAGLSP